MTKAINYTPISPSERAKKAEDLKKNYNKIRDKNSQKVRGKFLFHEVPNGSMSFVYGPMMKGDSTERYDFIDGQVYEIPLGLYIHLNKNGWHPQYGFIPGESVQGGYSPSSGMQVKQEVRRFSFQSLEFLDIEELPEKKIIEVEKVGL